MKTFFAVCSLFTGLAVAQAPPLNNQPPLPDNVVVQWDNALLQAIRVTHPGPPIVARALAITHTCMFDAWAAYNQTAVGTRLGGALRRPQAEWIDANKNKAVSFAA